MLTLNSRRQAEPLTQILRERLRVLKRREVLYRIAPETGEGLEHAISAKTPAYGSYSSYLDIDSFCLLVLMASRRVIEGV